MSNLAQIISESKKKLLYISKYKLNRWNEEKRDTHDSFFYNVTNIPSESQNLKVYRKQAQTIAFYHLFNQIVVFFL